MHLAVPILFASFLTLVFLGLWDAARRLRMGWHDTVRDWHLARGASEELAAHARTQYPAVFTEADAMREYDRPLHDGHPLRDHGPATPAAVDAFIARKNGEVAAARTRSRHGLAEPCIRTIHLAFAGRNADYLRGVRTAAVRRIANRTLTVVFIAILLTLLAPHWRLLLN